jgi:hypothetical protein
MKKKPRPGRPFTDEELAELRAIYEHARQTNTAPKVLDFCRRHDRHRPHVCRKARQLGIQFRPVHGKAAIWQRRQRAEQEERLKHRQAIKRERARKAKAIADWASSPIGSLIAKQRRNAFACKASAKAKARWHALSEEERQAILAKQKRTMIARYGSGSANRPHQTYTRGVGGTRADLGIFLRSTWEANWARILNHRIAKGEVETWKYEPRVFAFPDGESSGVLSYRPDFWVRLSDGTEEHHEVKGWEIPRYREARRLMRIHYPHVVIKVFGDKEWRGPDGIDRKYRDIIPHWEACPAATREKLARERAASRTRQCKQCGKDFAASGRRKFCSEVCSNRAQCVAHCEKQRARTTERRPTSGLCEWCGVEFEIGRMGRVRRFCCHECGMASWRVRQRGGIEASGNP